MPVPERQHVGDVRPCKVARLAGSFVGDAAGIGAPGAEEPGERLGGGDGRAALGGCEREYGGTGVHGGFSLCGLLLFGDEGYRIKRKRMYAIRDTQTRGMCDNGQNRWGGAEREVFR